MKSKAVPTKVKCTNIHRTLHPIWTHTLAHTSQVTHTRLGQKERASMRKGETERGVHRSQVATTHNIRTETQTLAEYIRLVCVCVYGYGTALGFESLLFQLVLQSSFSNGKRCLCFGTKKYYFKLVLTFCKQISMLTVQQILQSNNYIL